MNMEVHFCDKSQAHPLQDRFPAFHNNMCFHCGEAIAQDVVANTIAVHKAIAEEIKRQDAMQGLIKVKRPR